MPNHVVLIRHGQSAFNAAIDDIRDAVGDDEPELWRRLGVLRDDLSFLDTRLSDIGHQQVSATAAAASALDVDVVLVSPLTRALQTALGLFGSSDRRIEISHLHAERVFTSCDIGRSPNMLAEEFPMFEFGHLDDPWWYHHSVDGRIVEPDDAFSARVAQFSRFLAQRPEQRIAVVGHGLFFHAMCGRHLDNCEIAPFALSGDGSLTGAPGAD